MGQGTAGSFSLQGMLLTTVIRTIPKLKLWARHCDRTECTSPSGHLDPQLLRNYSNPHFRDENTETQRGNLIIQSLSSGMGPIATCCHAVRQHSCSAHFPPTCPQHRPSWVGQEALPWPQLTSCLQMHPSSWGLDVQGPQHLTSGASMTPLPA